MHKVDWLLILTYMQAVFPLESKSRMYNYILTQNYGCSSMLTVITPKYLDVLDIFIDEMSELKPQLFRIAYPHHSFSGGGGGCGLQIGEMRLTSRDCRILSHGLHISYVNF